MKRVVVTGGAGFIGRALVERLASVWAPLDLVVLDNMRTSRTWPDFGGTRFYGDVRHHDTVAHAVKNADLVIHLASLVGKRLVHLNPNEAFSVSRDGALNIFALTDCPVVLFSSAAVYGITPKTYGSYRGCLDYDGGVLGYASGKLQLEELGQAQYKRGRPILTIRPYNIAGPGQLPDYGMVIPRMVEAALSDAPITVYDDGSQTRSFGHIDRFVTLALELIEDQDAYDSTPFNIGSSDEISMLDLAELIRDTVKSQSKIVFKPYSTDFPGVQDTNSRRCLTGIGSAQWPSVAQIVQDYVDWRMTDNGR